MPGVAAARARGLVMPLLMGTGGFYVGVVATSPAAWLRRAELQRSREEQDQQEAQQNTAGTKPLEERWSVAVI